MIKIEVTGNSILELADKLLAIGASLQGIKTTVPHTWSDIKPDADIILEVAEAAPVDPTPAAEPAATLASSSKQAEAPTDTSAPATSVSELSFEKDVTPVVLAVVQTNGKPVVEEILSQFGVARASQLDPARWPELVAALQDKL